MLCACLSLKLHENFHVHWLRMGARCTTLRSLWICWSRSVIEVQTLLVGCMDVVCQSWDTQVDPQLEVGNFRGTQLPIPPGNSDEFESLTQMLRVERLSWKFNGTTTARASNRVSLLEISNIILTLIGMVLVSWHFALWRVHLYFPEA